MKPNRIFYSFPTLFDATENGLTSLGASLWTNSSKILLALEASLVFDRVFLKSSHASQKSRFSSLNSVFRKVWKAFTPPGEGREEQLMGQKAGRKRTSSRHSALGAQTSTSADFLPLWANSTL